MKTALYAGSFDPFTYGHKDIVLQALQIFDRVVIAIGENKKKTRNVPQVNSMNVIASYFPDSFVSRKIEVTTFSGALTDFAKAMQVDSIVRGLRQVSDFNDEFTLHGVVESVTSKPITYFICNTTYLHVSSSTAREMNSLGMNTNWLINDRAREELNKINNS